jgi:hypothetical protein
MLLLPDTEQIKQGTKLINDYVKTKNSVQAMMTVISSCPEDGVRQMAAVLLRKNITGLWKKLTGQVKTQVKALLLQRLVAEHVRFFLRFIFTFFLFVYFSNIHMCAVFMPALINSLCSCRLVRISIAALISALAKRLVPDNSWNELLTFLLEVSQVAFKIFN